MPASETKAPIFNRRFPILICNEAPKVGFNALAVYVRHRGLVNKIVGPADMQNLKALHKYSLNVIIVNDEHTPTIDMKMLLSTSVYKVLIINTGGNDLLEAEYRPYNTAYVESPPIADDVAEIIASYFKQNIPHSSDTRRSRKSDHSESLAELLSRLETATDAIADLRINSTSDVVGELRSVAQGIRLRLTDKGAKPAQDDVKNTVLAALEVLSKLYDLIDNSKLASIVVAGATTSLMGFSGLSALGSVTIMLASWHGKEAFLSAIDKLKPAKGSPLIENNNSYVE